MKLNKVKIVLIFLGIILLFVFLYLNFNLLKDSFFVVENSDIKIKKSDVIFKAKGLVYSPYYPNETGGELLPNDNRYFNHLRKIKNIGANSVSVFPQYMPENFYLALNENDLYYVQIIDINLYDGTSNRDLLNSEYQKKVISHAKEVIDHTYSTGGSDRLIYFTLGYEINPGYVKYTNNKYKDVSSYNGKYISIKNRKASEIALAKILDECISYEIKKYNKRSLYSHNSFPAYNLLANNPDLFPDFFDIFSINIYPSFFYDKDDYFNKVDLNEKSGFYDYLNNLNEKISKPTVISEIGLSSASTSSFDKGVPPYGDNTEEAVADLYLRSWSDIAKVFSEKDDSLNGIFYFEFNDEFWKNGEEKNDAKYHNPNDSEEWFGVYSIETLDTGETVLQEKKPIINALKVIFKQYD